MKQKLKTGLEFDVIYSRKKYSSLKCCYIKNNPKLTRFVKKQLHKRLRKELDKQE